MKFLATATLFASVALAAPNPEPWCYRVGEPCWKVKRTADAFVDSIKSTGGLFARGEEKKSEFKGIPDDVAISALQSINGLASLIAYNTVDPKAFISSLNSEEPKKDKNVKRSPEPWCMMEGKGLTPYLGCYWKRDANADEVAAEKRWCYRVGEPCWKAKRAADAVINATGEEESKSEANADEVAAEKRWCYRVGEPCWKAKRDLETVQAAAREVLATLE